MTRCRFIIPVIAALLFAGGSALAADPPKPADTPSTRYQKTIDAGDTAWMLVSTALVMFMVPGLALFYGGIVRHKNLLGTMMHSMIALGIIGVQWVLFGYALAFGETRGGLIGFSSDFLGLQGVSSNDAFHGVKIPIYVHCMYQGMFALITPALISGAIAERIRFGPYCLFLALWSLLVYTPLAHWVWAVKPDPTDPTKSVAAGWLAEMGALDFAGGTVVHIAAGFSALAAILLLRKRVGYPQQAMHPNSMVLTLFGAGILWFGWFGFNGGSGLGSGALAGSALTATQVAAATAGLAWVLVEWAHRGKPTALGFATGLVAGLVAVTPASGFVKPLGAIAIGLVVTGVCYAMVVLKPRFKYDDSLDAFGVHGVGGLVGALLTGVCASAALFKDSSGADLPTPQLGSSEVPRLLVQFVAAAVAAVFSFGVTAALVKVIDATVGFTLNAADEQEGLDYAVHGERAFDFGLAAEQSAAADLPEPRAAKVPPPAAKRFTVVVEGSSNGELMDVWSELCKAGERPPAPEFRAVYPHVTTVTGNRFRFSGGDPNQVATNLTRLFEQHLPSRKLVAHVEG